MASTSSDIRSRHRSPSSWPLLACGPQAVLSHRSAASVWQILPLTPGPVEVTVPGRRCRSRPGLLPHAGTLRAHEATTYYGLRVTTPARTLEDLRPLLAPATYERAANEAQVLRLIPVQVEHPGVTRSEAERRLLAVLRRAQLTPDATNVRVAGHEVDVLYRDQRLVVEVDGYAFHATRAAFERDRGRDAALAAAGFRVMRVTWRQVTDEPEAVVARLAAALAVSA